MSPYPTISPLLRFKRGGIFSAALSIFLIRQPTGNESKTPGVTERHALWCPDFPHPLICIKAALPSAHPVCENKDTFFRLPGQEQTVKNKKARMGLRPNFALGRLPPRKPNGKTSPQAFFTPNSDELRQPIMILFCFEYFLLENCAKMPENESPALSEQNATKKKAKPESLLARTGNARRLGSSDPKTGD